MLNITVTEETTAAPEHVLELAGTDFSAHRAKVWDNVDEKRLQVHERGDTYVHVTEYATGPASFAWERTRYDWSEAGTIQQTVLDSNVLEPGSTWELRVTQRQGGGSEVQMRLARRFRGSLAGGVAYFINHLGGRRLWGWYLRSALRAVEQASSLPLKTEANRIG